MSSLDNKNAIPLQATPLHADVKQELVLDSSVKILNELMRQLKRDPPLYQSKEVRNSIQVRVDAGGRYGKLMNLSLINDFIVQFVAECIGETKENAAIAAATKLIFAFVGDEIVKELTAIKEVPVAAKDFVSILNIQSDKLKIAKAKYIRMKTEKGLKGDAEQVFTMMCIYNDKRSEGTGKNVETAKNRAAAAMICKHGKKVVV